MFKNISYGNRKFYINSTITLLVVLFCQTVSAKTSSGSAAPSGLPLPSSLPLVDYEKKLYPWLMKQTYKTLDGWAVDKQVRDTGPFLQNVYYGTHPAVRIYYSPEIMTWLKNGRQGQIADGAMIIKEMYSPPAVLYQELETSPAYKNKAKDYEKLLGQLVSAWTIMVRDSKGSNDGWFWGGPGAPLEGESIANAVERQLDDYSHSLYSGFGLACLRCHASAETEFTFIDLQNIKGYETDQDPMRFVVDNSWRQAGHFSQYPLSQIADQKYVKNLFDLPRQLRPWSMSNIAGMEAYQNAHMPEADPDGAEAYQPPLTMANPEFIATFPEIPQVSINQVKHFPPQWADHVVPQQGGTEEYITSDNCLGCHGGLGGEPYGPTMFIETGPSYGDGFNVSEFGEWRWSPMGLAGRDPIFYAQLESEMSLLEKDAKRTPTPLVGSLIDNQQAVTNTCLSCHGAMGQRQLQIDAANDPNLDPNFDVNYVYLTEALNSDEPLPSDYAYHKYGELAREGISCMICHHIDSPDAKTIASWKPTEKNWVTRKTPKALAYQLFHNSTGHFERGPSNKIFGPYKDVATKPMEHTLGATPEHNAFIQDSQMCGTCHTINLPNIGQTDDKYPVLTAAEPNPALQNYPHTIEQATFLEWQNSAFAQSKEFASCQDCHMPGGFESLNGDIKIDQVTTQIATIQDANYPQAEHVLPIKDIEVPLRDSYKRHEHVGLNIFLLEMFNQFDNILGVDKTDYMTSATNGTDLAIENMLHQARHTSASIDVTIDKLKNNTLTSSVTVTNKAGHRLPSGVAFRRAFIEFLVMEDNRVVWSSGRTNSVGVILDGQGNPLNSEFLPNANTYQPHYQMVTKQDQVQIYEELNLDADNQFTTSFIHRVTSVKDNRLLPKGWRPSSYFKPQGQVMQQFMAATDPHGVGNDPDYGNQGAKFVGQDQLQYQVTLPANVDTSKLTVKATLYYQAIPPYWLKQRFSEAPDGVATQRLYYLTSNLNLQGTAIEDWKLPMVTASAQYQP